MAKGLFESGDMSDIPVVKIDSSELVDNKVSLITLIVKAEMAPSKNEARRLIIQNGISVDDEKISDVNKCFTKEELEKGIVIKKGRKVIKKIVL
jgi:tyrosyl-tRNA synthetase